MTRKKRDRSVDEQNANTQGKSEDSPAPEEVIVPDGEEEKGETESGRQEEHRFPIVGIGASAGGLEAFEQFFTNIPSDIMTSEIGMAFVLVQHLDPDHKSILRDLVKRYTRMEVFQVEDGMKIQPNCAYIIPPNRDMAVLHGILHLIEPTAARGFRLPIDFFLRSLAQDRGGQAICIILSGTGTDGTLGLRAIKGEGGMAMVQDPESVRYDGMPRSAIATGLVDYILPPDKMPEQLIKYVRRMSKTITKKKTASPPETTDWLQKIFILLRDRTGQDFSYYKRNTILRRVERRMTVHQIDRTADYIRYLQENPPEVETLFKELLIGVTSFFRDPEAFDALKEKAITPIFENKSPDHPVRIWVPGCSSGEEAYSIAMLIREHTDKLRREFEIQVFATDIDSDAIETARLGLYTDNIAVDVAPERLQRFFTKEDGAYRIKKTVRDMLVFAVQNVIKDPPFSRMDLISCRNLLIYMGDELQKKLLPLFHYSLNQDGYLFLGTSETIGSFADLFTVIDRKWKLFRRKGDAFAHRPLTGLPALASWDADNAKVDKDAGKRGKTLREVAERTLLDDYSPACVVIDEKCDILYVHGRTGKYLEQADGEASLNILKMAREGIRLELTTAIRKAMATKEDIRCEHLRVKTDGDVQIINLVVKPVSDPFYPQGLMMVMFEDVEPQENMESAGITSELAEEGTRRIVELEQELRSTREYLQTTIEELETANEELKSTNEELQSSNEELQSTNEELETSKEELQSVNEELVTVNSELEDKIGMLSKAQNDMNNLLASTEIGTIFLDNDLCVQRFTPSATQFINLIQADVGRPLSHIVSNLAYDHLVQDVKKVLDTLIRRKVEVQTNDGLWYSARIIPYRTTENVIKGVVVTFVNITDQKRVQEQLRKLTRAIEQSPSMVMIMDTKGNIEYVNSRFTKVTGHTSEELIGENIGSLQLAENSPELHQQLENTIETGEEWRGEVHSRKRNGEFYWGLVSISPVSDVEGNVTHFVVSEEDITQRKQAEVAVQRAREYADSIVATVREPLVVLGADLRIVSASRSFYQTFKLTPEETEGQLLYELGNRQWDIPKLRELLEGILPEDTTFDDLRMEHEFETIGRRTMLLNARRIFSESEESQLILLAMEDVTEDKSMDL